MLTHPRPPEVLEDWTVVIPTLGRTSIRETLASIAAGHAWPVEVIVVDQGGEATLLPILAEAREGGLRVQHIQSDQKGRAAAVNRGLEGAGTRYMAVTDDDCIADPRWLEALAARFRRAGTFVVTGRVDPIGNEPVVATVTSDEPATYTRPQLRGDVLAGGNLGVSREVLDLVGGFDEDPRLRAAEDCDWSYRALKGGVQVVYAPEVLVHHHGWRTEAQRAAQYRNYARSHGAFYGKHLRSRDAFILARVVVHHLRALKRCAVGLILRDRERVLNGSAYVRGLLPGILTGLRREPQG